MGEIKEMEVPDEFRCPISLDVMKDPVVLSTGITYDRHNIQAWLTLQSCGGIIKCPVTKHILRRNEELIPNHLLRRCIQNWCTQAIDAILSEVNSCKTGTKLKEALQKLKAVLGQECCTASRERVASSKLAASVFCGHCKGALEKLKESVDLCEEALGTLVMISDSTIDPETRGMITSSSEAFLCITRFLEEGNPNAVLILEKLAAVDPLYRNQLQASEGLAEGLVQLLRNDEPSTPTPVKGATITIMYYIATEEILRKKLVEGGAIALLLEILDLADRSIWETSLGLLDQLCSCAEGRYAVYEHALTLSVISKMILGVSVLATQLTVSILWTLSRYSDSPSVALDALREGLFQKLQIVVTMIIYGRKTRKRSSQLVQLFRHYRQDDSNKIW